MDQLAVHCGNEIPKILLGNKCDLLDPLELKQELERINPKIEKLKNQFGCEFFPVSAKNGENIEKAFQYLAERLA
jgi:GTPase SAR1 family protein